MTKIELSPQNIVIPGTYRGCTIIITPYASDSRSTKYVIWNFILMQVANRDCLKKILAISKNKLSHIHGDLKNENTVIWHVIQAI